MKKTSVLYKKAGNKPAFAVGVTMELFNTIRSFLGCDEQSKSFYPALYLDKNFFILTKASSISDIAVA